MFPNATRDKTGKFGGVNEFLDPLNLPEELVSYSDGGLANSRDQFVRLPGKLLHPNFHVLASSTGLPRVLDLTVVEFKSKRNVVTTIIHAGNDIVADTYQWPADSVVPVNPLKGFVL